MVEVGGSASPVRKRYLRIPSTVIDPIARDRIRISRSDEGVNIKSLKPTPRQVKIGLLRDLIMTPHEWAQLEYAWERNYVEIIPRAVHLLSRDDCDTLIGKAVEMTGIARPTVRYNKSERRSCKAFPKRWHLEISGWGKTPCSVLHEVAHLVAVPALMNGEDPHGPAFVRQAIDFYNKLIGIDLGYLVETAGKVGLPVGGTLYRHRVPRNPDNDFSHIEF